MASRSSAADLDVSIGWSGAVACGLLWGLAATLLDALVQPGAAPTRDLVLSMGIAWSLMGLCWSVGAKLAEPRLHFSGLAVLTVTSAITLSFAQVPLDHAEGWFWSSRLLGLADPLHLPTDALFSHVLWANLFYGGVYVAGYAASRRVLRSRARLERLQRSLEEDDARLDEIRLGLMRGQLQPQIMLTALAELKARYDAHAPDADRLLERLVAFLRAAMDRVRSGGETLAAELRVAEAYVRLRGELEGSSARWRADLQAAPLPFKPPRRSLLPIIVALGRSTQGVALKTELSEGRYYISMTAEGWRGGDLGEEVGVAVSEGLTFRSENSGWEFTATRELDAIACTLVLRLPARPETLAHRNERIAS